MLKKILESLRRNRYKIRDVSCSFSSHSRASVWEVYKSGVIQCLIIIILFFFTLNTVFPQEKVTSFKKQNQNTKYKSFSGGMRLSYGNNPSLLRFVQYELPDYFRVPESQQIPDFEVGYEFFAGFEYQVAKNFSLKADYSYFVKSMNSSASQYSMYDFTYNCHNILLTGYYLIPGEHFYLKFGAGSGMVLSNLSTQTFGLISNYNSAGLITKLESVLNTQISNSLAAYFGVFLSGTFNGTLKKSDGSKLSNRTGEEVNLNSFMLGLSLGFEYFIF
ncbi:MAG: hypothetical protein JW917_08995 [Ignavibacteria bacterium]|nr:hypothetical protein [Ignavibacteria bacterium]